MSMNNFDIIERYIKGELKDGDLWEFRKALEVDAELANDYRLYKMFHSQLNDSGKRQLYLTLNEIHHPAKTASISRRIGDYRIAVIAAAIALLFGLGVLMFGMFNNSTNQQLYANYFQPDKTIITVRSASATTGEAIINGMTFYEAGDFTSALAYFEKEPDNLLGKLYGGIALMELKNFERATAHFSHIIDHNDNLFIDQAEWYLSLCYLKTNKSKDAIAMLEKISGERGVFKTKAQMLLKDMKNK